MYHFLDSTYKWYHIIFVFFCLTSLSMIISSSIHVAANQFSSVTQSCPTLCDSMTVACQASLSITNSQSLFKLMLIKLVMPSNHLILYHPLLPPSVFPSIGVFSNESVLCIRWPKYWSFSFSISPSSEHPGLISFRMDWFDLLAVQGTLKSLLQHHSSKASILRHSAFFMVQLSHPYVTTGKTIALTIQTFVDKVMSLQMALLCSLLWLSNSPLCMYHIFLLFIYWWTLRLFPCLGYYKQCWHECWSTCIFLS